MGTTSLYIRNDGTATTATLSISKERWSLSKKKELELTDEKRVRSFGSSKIEAIINGKISSTEINNDETCTAPVTEGKVDHVASHFDVEYPCELLSHNIGTILPDSWVVAEAITKWSGNKDESALIYYHLEEESKLLILIEGKIVQELHPSQEELTYNHTFDKRVSLWLKRKGITPHPQKRYILGTFPSHSIENVAEILPDEPCEAILAALLSHTQKSEKPTFFVNSQVSNIIRMARAVFFATSLFITIAIISVTALLYSQKVTLATELEQLKSKSNREAKEEIQKLTKRLQKETQAIINYNKRMEESLAWSDFLERFAGMKPAEITLDRFTSQSAKEDNSANISLRGTCKSETFVSKFVENLKADKAMEKVAIKRLDLTQTKEYKFEILCKITL